LLAPATVTNGATHREPIGIQRAQHTDLYRAQRSGDGDADAGFSAGLAEAANFGGSEPIEQRGAVFAPGIKEKGAT